MAVNYTEFFEPLYHIIVSYNNLGTQRTAELGSMSDFVQAYTSNQTTLTNDDLSFINTASSTWNKNYTNFTTMINNLKLMCDNYIVNENENIESLTATTTGVLNELNVQMGLDAETITSGGNFDVFIFNTYGVNLPKAGTGTIPDSY